MVEPTSLTDWTALAAAAVLVARLAKAIRAGPIGWALAAATFALCFVSVAGVPIAGYVRGHVGDLSMSTVALLVMSFRGPGERRQRRAVAVTFSAAALGLYPMALGMGSLDPYRWGYAPFVLLAMVLGVSIFAIPRGLDVLLICLAAALVGYGLGVLESSNLWDYLIDPWLAIVAMFELVRLRSYRRPEALG